MLLSQHYTKEKHMTIFKQHLLLPHSQLSLNMAVTSKAGQTCNYIDKDLSFLKLLFKIIGHFLFLYNYISIINHQIY